jgi:transcriptional regulator with XRE-family HTH domain
MIELTRSGGPVDDDDRLSGEEVRAWRERLGLTQDQLGLEMGVTGTTIGRWEREERNVFCPRMVRLALYGLAVIRKKAPRRTPARKVEPAPVVQRVERRMA